MPRTRLVGLLAGIALMIACSPGTGATTTTFDVATTVTTQPVTTTTTTVSPTTLPTPGTIPPDQTVQVLLQPFSELGPAWTELLLPYGEGEDQLGTAPGGEGLMLGPDYGTQTPGGDWWILDAAKLRIARFASDGSFMESIPMPSDLLVDGQYFQYQLPQALDDGTVVATGFRGQSRMALMRIADGAISGSEFDSEVGWVTTDGNDLYGLGFDGAPHQLDLSGPLDREVPWLLGRNNCEYLVTVTSGSVVVEENFAFTRTLELRYSEDPDVVVNGGIEVEVSDDGYMWILFYGAPESDESLGVGGILSISPEGVVSEVEPIRDPSSPADPGSPARLGTTSGSTKPWLMMIDEDGVRTYMRESGS